MSFLDLMKQLFQHTAEPGEHPEQVKRLRERLSADPNDIEAFTELVEIAQNAEAQHPPADPLIAEHAGTGTAPAVSANLAIWALAEELSGNPSSWYPQLQLAKLSLPADAAGAVRCLHTVADRNPSGQVLAACINILAQAGMPDQALSLGLAHWDPATHGFGAARALIEAALAAGREKDARTYANQYVPYANNAEKRELAALVTPSDAA